MNPRTTSTSSSASEESSKWRRIQSNSEHLFGGQVVHWGCPSWEEDEYLARMDFPELFKDEKADNESAQLTSSSQSDDSTERKKLESFLSESPNQEITKEQLVYLTDHFSLMAEIRKGNPKLKEVPKEIEEADNGAGYSRI